MVAVNTGPRNQAIFLNQMMITIIGRWDPSGWTVLGSLEKVRLQFCILRAYITIKSYSKICLNESITSFFSSHRVHARFIYRPIYCSISLKPTSTCWTQTLGNPRHTSSSSIFILFYVNSAIQKANKNGTSFFLLHKITWMTDTTYILSALPKDYRIYTKTRKNGTHVS